MARIEDYALLGDTHSAALVRADGAIDWLCLPRFDSDACFAALLGGPENGSWCLGPAGGPTRTSRRYVGDTLVLETTLEAEGGVVRLVDFMPPRTGAPDVVRMVEGVSGTVAMELALRPRFGYGAAVPWARPLPGGASLVGGPDGLRLWSDVPVEVKRGHVRARFSLSAGARATFVLVWHPSHEAPPPPIDAGAALAETLRFWEEWSSRCGYRGRWREAVVRSLVTLKALTYAPSGGIVAAPTTSLPEELGGVRNWDYRFCWIRDATFTLYSLLVAGFVDEARDWRDWLLRAAAGDPAQLQILYGAAGERWLPELVLPWLPGYEGSAPVRIGNAAGGQLQLDVFGELMDCLHCARRAGLPEDPEAWVMQRALVDHLERVWREPDEGIWEVRGPRRPFTHSRLMVWVALDRAIRDAERLGLEAPLDRWRALRQIVHRQVCEEGWSEERKAFAQALGSRELDASLLMMPLVGFLPPDDPRIVSTVEAIQRDLVIDGFVRRYDTRTDVDGLPPGEGAFLPCTLWLADCLALLGRQAEAEETFERVLAVRNDVGLLAEEYDCARRRLVGNFPQAFSHVGLVNTARNLTRGGGPAEDRVE